MKTDKEILDWLSTHREYVISFYDGEEGGNKQWMIAHKTIPEFGGGFASRIIPFPLAPPVDERARLARRGSKREKESLRALHWHFEP